MRSKAARIISAIGAMALVIGLFVYGVLATIRISANLSGSFIFNVPPGMFHLDIEATMTGHNGENAGWQHKFDNVNINSVSWNLGNDIQFKESAEGEISDISFKFKVTNQNEENDTPGNNQVRITYALISESEEFIQLLPSANLVQGIVIQPLNRPVSGAEPQTDNQAEFEIVLSALSKRPTQNFEAGFSFRINFEFVV